MLYLRRFFSFLINAGMIVSGWYIIIWVTVNEETIRTYLEGENDFIAARAGLAGPLITTFINSVRRCGICRVYALSIVSGY